MQTCQFMYHPKEGWQQTYGDNFTPDLILAFGSGRDCSGEIIVDWWQNNFPDAELMGCSTSGEILGTCVSTNTIVVTGIKFSETPIELGSVTFSPNEDSHDIGKNLALSISHENLSHCIVLSEGLKIKGNRLVKGLEESLPDHVAITGGMAGDGKRFKVTQVCVNENFDANRVAILGLYGDKIKINYGSFGGWDTFGPNRRITKSEDNILYEMDGKSALALYKDYLGEYAKELPSSGLLFPLQVTTPDGKEFVRAVLGTDDEKESMMFAGDVPEGSIAKLMRANFDRLIDGASDAAKSAFKTINQTKPGLAILISCVGRRLVLGQRVEEEIEAVSEIFEDKVPLTGFYSYGEICPLFDEVSCTLHNQTMTITTLSEH